MNEFTVGEDASLKKTMRRIEQAGRGVVIVTDDENRIAGTVTDGDIRRAIMDGAQLEEPVSKYMTDDPIVVQESWPADEVADHIPLSTLRERMTSHEQMLVPVVDEDGRMVNTTFLSWSGAPVSDIEPSDSNVETVLVIGGAGYIGSVLCGRLLDGGYTVRVLDKLLFGTQGIDQHRENDRFTLIEGDMRSIGDVMDAIAGVDAVIHLGALVGDPASSIRARKTLEMNYHSVRLVAEVCKYHQINRFVFASTCSVYGKGEEGELLTEHSELNPVSLYAQTKRESEHAILSLADQNFSPTVLRMATIYGLSPRMRFDLVVNILTAKAVSEGVIPIYGGKQYRPNVHVADAARAFISCLEAPIGVVGEEVFNVGSNEQNYRVEEIGRIVNECVPDATIDFQRDKEDERSYQVDFTKIHDLLDYEVEYTIADGCREIKEALQNDEIGDYSHDQFNNYRTLVKNMDALEE